MDAIVIEIDGGAESMRSSRTHEEKSGQRTGLVR